MAAHELRATNTRCRPVRIAQLNERMACALRCMPGRIWRRWRDTALQGLPIVCCGPWQTVAEGLRVHNAAHMLQAGRPQHGAMGVRLTDVVQAPRWCGFQAHQSMGNAGFENCVATVPCLVLVETDCCKWWYVMGLALTSTQRPAGDALAGICWLHRWQWQWRR